MLTKVLAAVAVAVLLAFSYVAAYLALVEFAPMYPLSGVGPWQRFPHYAVGGEYAEVLFWPAHAADRRTRKQHWEYDRDDDDF